MVAAQRVSARSLANAASAVAVAAVPTAAAAGGAFQAPCCSSGSHSASSSSVHLISHYYSCDLVYQCSFRSYDQEGYSWLFHYDELELHVWVLFQSREHQV